MHFIDILLTFFINNWFLSESVGRHSLISGVNYDKKVDFCKNDPPGSPRLMNKPQMITLMHFINTLLTLLTIFDLLSEPGDVLELIWGVHFVKIVFFDKMIHLVVLKWWIIPSDYLDTLCRQSVDLFSQYLFFCQNQGDITGWFLESILIKKWTFCKNDPPGSPILMNNSPMITLMHFINTQLTILTIFDLFSESGDVPELICRVRIDQKMDSLPKWYTC